MARKCRKGDKNPPLRCVLKGFAHLGAKIGHDVGKGISMKAKAIHEQQKRQNTIPNTLVGNKKLGHGGFCHMNAIKNKKGSRGGGEGLRRVGKSVV
jgi:hypothetical protein